MINLFIGYDRKETIAYHVLAHSILSRSSEPVSIIPLNRENLKAQFIRPRGALDSTEFSMSRFIVPHLMNFQGHAIFMDCDMLCLGDIAELWAQRDYAQDASGHIEPGGFAVLVKKHTHEPKEGTKFLGAEQTKYARKNWSSLVLFDCNRCRPLTRHIVNTQNHGLWFHQFDWLPDEEIGAIDGPWNHLAGYDDYDPDAKLVHFTHIGPWHDPERTADIDYRVHWELGLQDMLCGDNPHASSGAIQAAQRSILGEGQ